MKTTTTFALFLAAVPVIVGCSSSQSNMGIHLIGDSTMADYEENTTQVRGWGEMFCQFVPDGVTVYDHAKQGRSSRSFYDEGRWATVKESIRPNDIVLIQFAHNDEKEKGADGADGRGTAPWTTYRDYLKKYIQETRSLGAHPILVQPIVRRYFDGNAITEKGQHNLGSANDSTLSYPAAMRSVAKETGVPLLDLCAKSRQIVEAFGPTESKKQLYVNADNTHTSMMGAALFALAVAEALDTMHVWCGEMKHPEIITNPSSFDFGDVFIGDTVWQTFDVIDFKGVSTIRPLFLTHRQPIALKSTDGLLISSDVKSVRRDTLNFVTNCGATVIAFYAPQSGKKEKAKIKISTPTSETFIPVSAQGRMIKSKRPVDVNWQNLSKQEDSDDLSLSFSKLKSLAQTESGYEVDNKFWPAEIDENGERFIQLKLTPVNHDLKIKKVSIKTSGAFSYRMSCALGNDFYHNKVIGERQWPVEDDYSTDVFSTSISVHPSQSLFIRIYPWSRKAVENLTFSASDLHIEGVVIE